MKTIKFITSTAFFSVLIISACYGQAKEKLTIQPVGSDIFKLVYNASQQGTVKVSILTATGQSVFTETLYKISSFVRPYNFADQASGNYKFLIEDKDGKTEKEISYSLKKVESTIEVSKIANAENKYLLSVENKDLDQIQVRILDNEKNILHEESITVNGKFAVVFNLNKVKTHPTFEVMGSNGVPKTFNF